ncbi:zinc metallopeptidase [Hydrogenibacillus schlegelii]|nr:zinc metallopeptidase [Hydrogenibacillus schlegelii]MBT9281597.1 zinc metallopeptidase [Hydrogenibacillus schlegelii]OAR03385.1 peptidase [Hydrogenibacillus schlegelii]
MYVYTPWTILILAAFGLAMWAQFRVQGAFHAHSRERASSGLTGAEAAREMLYANGITDVRIEPVPGTLTDHYDPVAKVIRLSEPVYGGRSISAVSVACHEVGHAIQHKVRYPMLVFRHAMVPVTQFASGIAPLLLLAGFFFKLSGLLLLGIIAFSFAVLFHVVTLPVEFDASRRAKEQMVRLGIISAAEKRGADRVLGAAALTYVAATLVAVLQLLEYIWLFNRQENEQ